MFTRSTTTIVLFNDQVIESAEKYPRGSPGEGCEEVGRRRHVNLRSTGASAAQFAKVAAEAIERDSTCLRRLELRDDVSKVESLLATLPNTTARALTCECEQTDAAVPGLPSRLVPLLDESGVLVQLQHLALHECGLTADSALELVEAIGSGRLRSLTSIDLTSNESIGGSATPESGAYLGRSAFAAGIASVLGSRGPSCQLQELRLAQCNLTVIDCTAILRALRGNDTLRVLDLSENHMTDALNTRDFYPILDALEHGLQGNCSLYVLGIGGEDTEVHTVEQVLRVACRLCVSLRCICLWSAMEPGREHDSFASILAVTQAAAHPFMWVGGACSFEQGGTLGCTACDPISGAWCDGLFVPVPGSGTKVHRKIEVRLHRNYIGYNLERMWWYNGDCSRPDSERGDGGRDGGLGVGILQARLALGKCVWQLRLAARQLFEKVDAGKMKAVRGALDGCAGFVDAVGVPGLAGGGGGEAVHIGGASHDSAGVVATTGSAAVAGGDGGDWLREEVLRLLCVLTDVLCECTEPDAVTFRVGIPYDDNHNYWTQEWCWSQHDAACVYDPKEGDSFPYVGARLIDGLDVACRASERAGVEGHRKLRRRWARLVCMREKIRRDAMVRWRRGVAAKRDARMVFQAASEGRPMELAKRLVLGAKTGVLEAKSEFEVEEDGVLVTKAVLPVEAARLGGHDECVGVLEEAKEAVKLHSISLQ